MIVLCEYWLVEVGFARGSGICTSITSARVIVYVIILLKLGLPEGGWGQ